MKDLDANMVCLDSHKLMRLIALQNRKILEELESLKQALPTPNPKKD
jgi:hypothetical protein